MKQRSSDCFCFPLSSVLSISEAPPGVNAFLSYLCDSLVRRDRKSGLYIDQASSEIFCFYGYLMLYVAMLQFSFVVGVWREISMLVFHTFWLLNTETTLALSLPQIQTSERY